MSIRSERIQALVDSSGLSYQELEKLTGIKKSSLQRYASGATTKIPLEVIEKLSKAFNVSKEYLMGWDEKENPPSHEDDGLSEEKRELIERIKKLPEDKVLVLLQVARSIK